MQVPINSQTDHNQDDALEQKARDLLERIQEARNKFEENTGKKVDQLVEDAAKTTEDGDKINDDIVAFLQKAAEDLKNNDADFDQD